MAFNFQEYNQRYLENARQGNPPVNDAAAYNVRLIPATVAEGQTYWKIIGIHHLLPEENMGNHHVYLESLDEQGNRIRNPFSWAGWTWKDKRPDERADPVPLDKPDYEAAGNIAMHFGQIVSVWLKGLYSNSNDITDTAENIHTNHPDEPAPDGSLWNSLGHHSFYVVFQRTRKTGSVTNGKIFGTVERGQGYTVQLQKDNQVLQEQTLDHNQTFKFDNLAYGIYAIEVVGSGVKEENIQINADKPTVQLHLEIPLPTNSSIYGAIENGTGRNLLLISGEEIIEQTIIPVSTNYSFNNLGQGVYAVQVQHTDVRQDNIVLNGNNSREVNLVVSEVPPPISKIIPHYILFGPPGSYGRKVNVLISGDFAQFFSITSGYSVSEAKQARYVTIIGEGISHDNIDAIHNSGSKVELLIGNAYQIEAELRERIRTGNAFPKEDGGTGPF